MQPASRVARHEATEVCNAGRGRDGLDKPWQPERLQSINATATVRGEADSSEGKATAKYRGNHFHGCKQMTSETVATISTVAGRTVEINDTNRGNHCHNPRKRREQSVSLTAAACHPAQQTMVFRCDVACRFLLFATSARATSRSTAASGPHMVTQRSRTLRDATTRATTHGHADGHARPPPRRVDAGGCRGRRKNLAQPSTHTPAIVAKSKGTSAGVWRLRPA